MWLKSKKNLPPTSGGFEKQKKEPLFSRLRTGFGAGAWLLSAQLFVACHTAPEAKYEVDGWKFRYRIQFPADSNGKENGDIRGFYWTTSAQNGRTAGHGLQVPEQTIFLNPSDSVRIMLNASYLQNEWVRELKSGTAPEALLNSEPDSIRPPEPGRIRRKLGTGSRAHEDSTEAPRRRVRLTGQTSDTCQWVEVHRTVRRFLLELDTTFVPLSYHLQEGRTNLYMERTESAYTHKAARWIMEEAQAFSKHLQPERPFLIFVHRGFHFPDNTEFDQKTDAAAFAFEIMPEKKEWSYNVHVMDGHLSDSGRVVELMGHEFSHLLEDQVACHPKVGEFNMLSRRFSEIVKDEPTVFYYGLKHAFNQLYHGARFDSHPEKNARELYASTVASLRHHPQAFFEKLRAIDDTESRRLGVRIARLAVIMTIESTPGPPLFPPEVYEELAIDPNRGQTRTK